MKLSTKGRYAVMAMADLTARSNGKPITLGEIAQRQNISLSYLEQLFAKLRRGGLVRSVRGPGGGYLLAKPSEVPRISHIISPVADPLPTTRGPAGSPQGCIADQSRCITHDLWGELGNHIHLFLSSGTLADVCEKRVLGMSGVIYRKAASAAE